MVRPRNWAPPDGEEASESIFPALNGIRKHVGIKGIDYKSRNGKTNIDVSGLVQIKEGLAGLCTIQAGIPYSIVFSHEHIEEWVLDVHNDELYKASLTYVAAERQLSEKELVADTACVIRVMYAHVRERCKQYLIWKAKPGSFVRDVNEDVHPAWMRELYGMLEPSTALDENASIEPVIRLSCKFVHFQAEVNEYRRCQGIDSEAEDLDDQPEKVVYEGWDFYSYMALRRYCSGRIEEYDHYEKNESTGFIDAVFKDGKIALEILNEKLRDDGTIEISAPINPEMLTEGSEAAIAHMEALTATRLKTEEKKRRGKAQ